MYSLSVRSHFMIAHSFRGAIFGPAQGLHGATYVVDVEFRRRALDADGLVVDIGLASEVVQTLLAELNYKNLDEVEAFNGSNTTTEFLAGYLHGRLAEAVRAGRLGENAKGIEVLKVALHESHIASAAYEAAV